MKYLNATGQVDMNDTTLFKILSTPPLLRRSVLFTHSQLINWILLFKIDFILSSDLECTEMIKSGPVRLSGRHYP